MSKLGPQLLHQEKAEKLYEMSVFNFFFSFSYVFSQQASLLSHKWIRCPFVYMDQTIKKRDVMRRIPLNVIMVLESYVIEESTQRLLKLWLEFSPQFLENSIPRIKISLKCLNFDCIKNNLGSGFDIFGEVTQSIQKQY